MPFTKLRLSPDDIDLTLESRMHTELEGVFARAVYGLQALIDRGAFDTPQSVIDATTDYRDTSDPIRRFVNDRFTITGSSDDRESRHAIFAAYKAWCDDENHRSVAAPKFWQRVRTIDQEINVDGPVVHGARYVSGVRLESPP